VSALALLCMAAAAGAAMLGWPGPPPPRQVPPVATVAGSAAAAVTDRLAGATGVVAFGEVHQDQAGKGTRSALVRFTDEILPVIAPRASHLIVETWVTSGACGEAEARVTEDVARTTERPAETESEIVRLLRRAKESGVQPHVLSVSCEEYRTLGGDGGRRGRVDYDKLLTLTGRHLEAAVRQAVYLPRLADRPLVLVYGGALHNDLYPERGLEPYSFGPAIHALMHGDYREVDLYVPQFAARLASMRAERWYAVWRRRASPGATVVIPRSARSAIVVFPRAARPQR
jgi:hypothetical protein